MGLPYSRQINAAFDQVTPLVAAGFKVLRTTRDISILLAVIQVLTVILLTFILFALVLLLYSVNPDLEVRFLVLLPLTVSSPAVPSSPVPSSSPQPEKRCTTDYTYTGREKNPDNTASPIPRPDHTLVDFQICLLDRSCVWGGERGDVAFFRGEAVGRGCRV